MRQRNFACIITVDQTDGLILWSSLIGLDNGEDMGVLCEGHRQPLPWPEMGQHLTSNVQAAFAGENLTTYQGIILASIVIQEVNKPADQAQAAQVFLSRYKTGMTLGSDVTANAGFDYVAESGTVTFAPGQTTRTIGIVVNADSLDEPTETFFVNLTDANGAVVTERVVNTLDFMASMCRVLGIDHNKMNNTPIGRPVRIVDRGGNPIPQLF